MDEGLRGYFTKYDCSSADLNPIGGVSKVDLRAFLRHAAVVLDAPCLHEIAGAAPTAELVPSAGEDGAPLPPQLDEVDMGMSYDELACFGRLRMVGRAGPLSMYHSLRAEWPTLPPGEVAGKVEHFFKCYATNRHKMTTLPPAYHAEVYSPDDNRHDLRPFVYHGGWSRQFRCIRAAVAAEVGGGTHNAPFTA